EFISVAEIPTPEAGLSLAKINTIAIPSTRPLLRFATRVAARAGVAERDYRDHLGSLQPFGGGTWWALTRDACEYITEFAVGHPDFCDFFTRTHSSDETFFHTILANSAHRTNIRRSLMFDDWSA